MFIKNRSGNVKILDNNLYNTSNKCIKKVYTILIYIGSDIVGFFCIGFIIGCCIGGSGSSSSSGNSRFLGYGTVIIYE